MKTFQNEVQILSKIQHQNIIKLHDYCLHKRCMLLIYKYRERGSLFCVLSNEVEALELDWIKRLNVVKSIVHASTCIMIVLPPLFIGTYQATIFFWILKYTLFYWILAPLDCYILIHPIKHFLQELMVT